MTGFKESLGIILSIKNGLIGPSFQSTLLPKCLSKLSPSLAAIYKTALKNIGSKLQLEQYLSGEPNIDKDKILSIYQVKHLETKKMQQVILLFNQFVESIDQVASRKDYIYRGSHLLEKLKTQEATFMGLLLKALIALQIDNFGLAQKHINNLIYSDTEEIIFQIQRHYFKSQEDFKRFYQNLLSATEYIEKKLKNTMLFKLYITHLASLFHHDQLISISQQYAIDWSLNTIRKILKSKNYGLKYPGLWYKILIKKAQIAEVLKFIEDALTPSLISKMHNSLFPIVQDYLTAHTQKRNAIFTRITSLIHSQKNYDNYILLQLLKNNTVKQFVIKKRPALNRTSFQLERQFYRDTMSQGKALEFSLYNLIKLGDHDTSLLWWVVL
ncbi:MAG: hypothetical protein ISR65_13700 [Bacteriovoracaceae bacterium]|nr:hypothetical protein [Bacteriovoracaceae bacterium]